MRPLVLPFLVLLSMSPALRAAGPQAVFEDKFEHWVRFDDFRITEVK